MADITLSKSVRANLLNLQSTANLLSKSQERLSTGLRVNSALDNPTNFFTAQGLTSRANDLGQLLDAVSNAVQTVAAADKGISAITKVVESAQATARQALQTSATVQGDGLIADDTGSTDLSTFTAVAGDAGTISINGQTVTIATGDTGDDVFANFQAAAVASRGTAQEFTVSQNASNQLVIETTYDGAALDTTGSTAASVTALGLTAAGSIAAATASTDAKTINPKRAELVDTYNDLLGQIDALAKDSGFNGVNLLAGDNLQVLFNEDGSSKITIAGVDNTASNLGLDALVSTAFDSNTSINSTLDDLKAGIETLRGQASKFGSNLSVVETRQDFTKNMISVLQTGASNLTLADSNLEAANVLALQTRQQLSST
ncbi:MAG: hypothetical protein ABL866_12500, partial [Devosia sp.]